MQKIISYETTTAGSLWANTVVAVGGYTFSSVSGEFPYEGEETCEVALSGLERYEKVRLNASTGNFTSERDVSDAINIGCGFVFTHGKEGTDRVRIINLEGTEMFVLQNNDIISLKNTDKYPICILDECWHGKFDVCLIKLLKRFFNDETVQPSDCIPYCIAWWLVKHSTGGAVATITNTNTCFGTFRASNNNDIIDDAEQFGGFLGVEFFRHIGQQKKNTNPCRDSCCISHLICKHPSYVYQ